MKNHLKKIFSIILLFAFIFQIFFPSGNIFAESTDTLVEVERATGDTSANEVENTSEVSRDGNNENSGDSVGENTPVEENTPENNARENGPSLRSAGDVDDASTTDEATTETQPATTETSESNRLKVDLDIFAKTGDGADAGYTHLSGKDILAYAEFKISGDGVKIPNAKSKITFPKENVDGKPQFSGLSGARSWKQTEDNENWYVEYDFENLYGGQIAAVAIPFKMKQPTTPNNYEKPVTLELFREDGSSLGKITKNFITETKEAKPFNVIRSRVNNNMYDLPNSSSVYLPWSSGSISSGTKNILTIDGNKVIEQSISTYPDESNTHTRTGDSAPYVGYSIGIQKNTQGGNFGNYIPKKVKIEYKLPEGATMKQTPSNGLYHSFSYNGVTYGWTYNESINTATYEGPLDTNSQSRYIEISYPGVEFVNVLKTTAKITLEPGTDSETVLPEVSEYIKFKHSETIRPVPRANFTFDKGVYYHNGSYPTNERYSNVYYYYSNLLNSSENLLRYNVSIYYENNNVDYNGEGPIKSYITEIIDQDLDSRLDYYGTIITSDSIYNSFKLTGFKFIGVKEDDSETILGENIKEVDLSTSIEKYKKIILRFNEPHRITSSQWYFMQILAKVKDEVYDSWENEDLPTRNNYTSRDKEAYRLNNTAILKYTHSNQEGEKEIKDTYWASFIKEEIKISSDNTTGKQIISYSDNNKRSLYFDVKLKGYMAPISNSNPATNYIVRNVKHITILPNGIEYVEDSETQTKYRGKAKIVKNFRNTGKTAVIYELGDVVRNNIERVDFKINTTLATAEGDNTLEHYLVWDNNDTITRFDGNKSNYVDALDLDEDGNTTEVFLKSTNTITFIPPKEILVKKYASVDKKNWSAEVTGDINSEVYYKVSVLNNTFSNQNSINVIDVLPYVGDHTIVPNQAGEYLPRDSVFPIKLSKSLESVVENASLLSKYDVTYSTQRQGATMESVRDATFVQADQIQNWEDVTMFKIKLKQGQVLAPKEEVNFVVVGKTPNDKNLENFSSSKNSVAISFDNVSFTEGKSADVSVISNYTINGKVFIDVDKDGNLGDNDNLAGNYTLELMNGDGSPVLGDDGVALSTTSGVDGTYSFKVHKRGEYFVKITKKSNTEEFTSLYRENGTRRFGVGNDAIADETNENFGKTEKFTIDPSKITSSYNLGFTLNYGVIRINKKNAENEPISNTTFRIEKDRQKVGESKTTNDKGFVLFDNLEFGTYSIIEESAANGYVLNTTPIEVEVTRDNQFVVKEVVNQKQRWNIKVIKLGNDGQRLSGASFKLQKRVGRKVIDVKEEQTTNQNGEIIFTDVEYGDYELVETSAPIGYKLLENPIIISTDKFVTTTNDLTFSENVTNEAKLYNLKVILKDKIDDSLLQGGKFKLQKRNGNVVTEVKAEVTTGVNGEVIFREVPFGNYELVETSSPNGYKDVTNPFIISSDNFVGEEGTEIEKIVKNEKQKWNLKIVKFDNVDNTKKLQGAKFELQNNDGEVVKTEQTTNKNGEIIFTDVEYGVYKIVETEAPVGYKKFTNPVMVNLDLFDKTEEELLVNITNEKQLWNVKVSLSDKLNNTKKLQGASFELRNSNNQVIQGPLLTNNLGEIIFRNVEYGNYKLVETEASEGYKPLTEAVDISANSFNKDLVEIPVNVVNEKQKWNLKVILKDNLTKEPLSGGKFELRVKNGTVLKTELTTGENGEVIFSDIEYGEYELFEKQSPDGYLENKTPIIIPKNIFEKDLETVTKIVENEKQKWNLKIILKNEKGELLENGKFELQREDGQKIDIEKITNKGGEVLFENLEYGNYKIIQKQSPDGYNPLKEAIVISKGRFTKNLIEVVENIVNTKIPGAAPNPESLKIEEDPRVVLGGTTRITKEEKVNKEETKRTLGEKIPEDKRVTTPEKIKEEPKKEIITKKEEKKETKKDNKENSSKIVKKQKLKDFEPVGPELSKIEKGETEIKKYVKVLPKTGVLGNEKIYNKVGLVKGEIRRKIDVKLPKSETFRLAGSKEKDLTKWLEVLPKQDRTKEKYIVLPKQGLVMPVNTVGKEEKAYKNFINGKEENFYKYLNDGSVELPGTSTRGYGEVGNKVIGGHSSFWSNGNSRYRTHFQKIIEMEKGEEIWIYERNKETKEFERYVYIVRESYNTDDEDISVLKPTDKANLTLFTCTPIGGVAGRWIVKSEFVSKN